MKLWILEAREDLPEEDNPFEPVWDKDHGFIVRADTEGQARKLARCSSANPRAWDEKYSTCIELLPDGAEGVIMQDHCAG